MSLMKLQRRFADLGIGGRTARMYDTNTRRYRLEEMRQYAKEVASLAPNGASILEVAPGPGYLSIELAKLGQGYRITGIDISKEFVEIAKRNAIDYGVEGQVEFREGNASDLCVADNAFDFIVCTAAFKNFKDPVRALNEMYRVLREDRGALIIDMNANAPHEQIDAYVRSMSAKGMGRMFLKFTFEYLRDGAYTRDQFLELISKTEFKEYNVKEEGIGLRVHLKK